MSIPTDIFDRLTFLATTGRGHSLHLGNELSSKDPDKANTYYAFANLFEQIDELLQQTSQAGGCCPSRKGALETTAADCRLVAKEAVAEIEGALVTLRGMANGEAR